MLQPLVGVAGLVAYNARSRRVVATCARVFFNPHWWHLKNIRTSIGRYSKQEHITSVLWKNDVPLLSEPASRGRKLLSSCSNNSKMLRLPKRQIIHCREREVVIISGIDRQISDAILLPIRFRVCQLIAGTASSWVVACDGGRSADVGEGGEIREYMVTFILNAIRSIWAGDIVERRGAVVVGCIVADVGGESKGGEDEGSNGSSELHVGGLERVG